MGKELTVIRQLAVSYHDAIAQLGQKTSFHQNDISHQVVLNLMGEAENPCDLVGEVYNEEKMLPVHHKDNDGIALGLLYVFKSILCYMFGNYGQAMENMSMFGKYIEAAIGTMVVPVGNFYESLGRLAVLSETKPPALKEGISRR